MMTINFCNRTIFQRSLILIAAVIEIIWLTGCSNELDEFTESGNKTIKQELIFINDAKQSRGVISEFPDGAELHIKFNSGGNWLTGWCKATYNAIERKWIIEISEDILNVGSGLCTVLYSDTGDFTISSFDGIEMTENISLMIDEVGQWNAYGDIIAVTAHLNPAFSRIRFLSDTPTEVWVKGFGLPYLYYGTSNYPAISSSHLESAPCYPKLISVNQKGEDGKFYSKYYYTHTTNCKLLHTSAGIFASSWEYLDCPENLKLSIYYPSETSYYYYKKLPEFKAGESYLVELPSTSNYSGWTRNNNIIKTISTEIKIGLGSNTNHTYEWSAGSVVYGKSINFELSSNGGDGYVSISGTDFSYNPVGAYSGKRISTIYHTDYGYGQMTFRFNVSSLTKYYTTFGNVTLSHFPIYDLFVKE